MYFGDNDNGIFGYNQLVINKSNYLFSNEKDFRE